MLRRTSAPLQRRIRLLATLLVVAMVASACGGAASNTATDAPGELALADTTTTAAPSTTTAPTTTAAPSTTTTTSTTTSTIPPDPFRTWVATAHDDVTQLEAYVEPDGNRFPLPFLVPNPHQFGTALTLMITEGEPGDEWVKVQLPIRPNAQEAWINTENYDITSTRVHAEIDLTNTRVRVWDGEELLAESEAVIGAERSPTPVGTFAVAAVVDDYFGSPALVLTAFSETLETFSGGLPVIAIHVTLRDGQEQDPSVRSNGCIRIPPDAIEFLAQHVPLGAPVTVVA